MNRQESQQKTMAPKVSVIIPFCGDTRGNPRHVLSWTRKQTCAAADFEVIVVYSGYTPEWRTEISGYLRPHDRLIHFPAINSFALYDVGARAARGDILLITEDHCVAEAECVTEVLRFFATHAEEAASIRAGHINHTEMARMEECAYERNLPLWLASDCWDKVRVRGFAIRRDLYFATGGLPGRYDHFAETVLAARLHGGGHKVGFIEKPCVRHVNTPSFRQMFDNIRCFIQGECIFRDRGETSFCERYFPAIPGWAHRLLYARRTSLAAAWAIARTIARHRWRFGELRALGTLLRQFAVRLAHAAAGPRLRLVGARRAMITDRLRYALCRRNEPRRIDAFMDWWWHVSCYHRLRYLVSHATDDLSRAADPLCRYDMAKLPPEHSTGFHDAESWNGTTVRWTAPVAIFRVNMPAGDHEVTIDTASLRGPGCDFPLGLFWNGRMIPRKSIQIDRGRIRFPIGQSLFAPGPEQRLTIVCAPCRLRQPGEPAARLLGLPVRSIEIRRAEEATGASRKGLAA